MSGEIHVRPGGRAEPGNGGGRWPRWPPRSSRWALPRPRPPSPRRPRPDRNRRTSRRVAASAAAAVRATASRADAAAGRVPASPPGWTTEFADNFNGPARSKPATAKWHYDVGPGSSFGTGEIETMTDSTRNGYLTGGGRLHLSALDNGGSWTSARIQTNTANVGAPPGGKFEVTASIRQPSPAGGSATGRPSGCSDRASGRRTARSTSWRTSTPCPSCPVPSTAVLTRAAGVPSRTASAAGCSPAPAARAATTATR